MVRVRARVRVRVGVRHLQWHGARRRVGGRSRSGLGIHESAIRACVCSRRANLLRGRVRARAKARATVGVRARVRAKVQA
jgi:hypothetical protein